MARVSLRKPPSPRQRATLSLAWLKSVRLWTAAGWIGAAALAAYGARQLEPYVHALAGAPTRIEWANLPNWLQRAPWSDVLGELEGRLEHPDVRVAEWDVYDVDVCAYTASKIRSSPWIEELRRVSKSFDGVIRVDADFRQPFAIVQRGPQAFLVSRSGVRLPPTYDARDVNRQGWLVIRGVQSDTPDPGGAWDASDLADGLKLAEFLYQAELTGDLPDALRGALWAIDVSNHKRRVDPWAGEMRLITTNDRFSIHWGLPPGEEYDIEAPAARKLSVLKEAFASLGDALYGQPIDVRSGETIVLERG